MQLPIYIGRETVGELSLEREGRFWLARARLRDQKRVLRLFLYGKGEPVYLGIPEPRGGEMVLDKKLPALPAELEYCAEKPRTAAAKETPTAPTAPPKIRRRVWMGGRPYYF